MSLKQNDIYKEDIKGQLEELEWEIKELQRKKQNLELTLKERG